MRAAYAIAALALLLILVDVQSEQDEAFACSRRSGDRLGADAQCNFLGEEDDDFEGDAVGTPTAAPTCASAAEGTDAAKGARCITTQCATPQGTLDCSLMTSSITADGDCEPGVGDCPDSCPDGGVGHNGVYAQFLIKCDTPNTAGCYMKVPNGCPDQVEYESGEITAWTQDDHETSSDSKSDCDARKSEWDAWCGNEDSQWFFVEPGNNPGTCNAGMKVVGGCRGWGSSDAAAGVTLCTLVPNGNTYSDGRDDDRICTKFGVYHVHGMSKSAGVLAWKRIRCNQDSAGEVTTCVSYKGGRCVDVGEEVWAHIDENNVDHPNTISHKMTFGSMAAAQMANGTIGSCNMNPSDNPDAPLWTDNDLGQAFTLSY